MILHPRAILRAGINAVRKAAGADPLDDKTSVRAELKQAGQIVVIFALMLTVLIGMVGIAIDTTYAWRESLRVQRAADAAALAGVVYMPGNFNGVGGASQIALGSATQNGFTSGGGTTVTPAKVDANPRELDVTITTPVPTFFARIFGINSFAVSRIARAVYVMPVAMGSPLSYYGIGCFMLQGGSAPPCNGTGTGASGVTASGLGTGSGALGSLGSWGAISTKGGNAGNGDAFGTANETAPFSGANPQYRPSGYYYQVTLPVGGDISIFDAGFCAMGNDARASSGSTGNYGAGDHWVGSTGSSYPVSTYYQLWTTNDQPINPAAWTKIGSDTGSTFENQSGYDASNLGYTSGGAAAAAPSGATAGTGGCSATYHNKWWTWKSGLAPGTYDVQVYTTNPGNAAINATTNAQNMFGIEASGTGSTVSGQSSMCVYNNLADPSGTSAQKFYLGKVDQITGAGKTLQIDLFDIGDVNGAGVLKIWSPNGSGGTSVAATFNFTTDSNWGVQAGGGGVGPASGNGVSSITTAAAGKTSNYQNTWIHVMISLPTNYGAGGLWQGGWWQIEYDITGGGASDLTTWAVNVVGNPVHLI